MSNSQTHIYEFDEFRLDAAKRLLSRGGETIALMPKAFDTLLYLVENGGRVVEKDELMAEIWTDAIVEENNLSQNISILRRVLGEKKNEHRFIVTVPSRGFKFVAEVRPLSQTLVREPKPATSACAAEIHQENNSRCPDRHRCISSGNDDNTRRFVTRRDNRAVLKLPPF